MKKLFLILLILFAGSISAMETTTNSEIKDPVATELITAIEKEKTTSQAAIPSTLSSTSNTIAKTIALTTALSLYLGILVLEESSYRHHYEKYGFRPFYRRPYYFYEAYPLTSLYGSWFEKHCC